MIDKMRSLNAEYLASSEVQEKLERERKAEMMAKLGEEEIYVVKAKAEQDSKAAGAITAMLPPTKLKEMTVAEAAEKAAAGKLGDGDEQREVLGSNFAKVQEYREYITLPGQS